MKCHTQYLTFTTRKRREMRRITDECHTACRDSGIKEGMLLVSAMHITAAVFVNDDEPGLHADIEEWANRLAPEGPPYQHHRTGEDNGDAHLKNLLIGHQVIVPITEGKLDLGPWQQVFYYECDGKRPKRLVLKAIGE
jgi:secondary thiamine-phosphate synthase enzyme